MPVRDFPSRRTEFLGVDFDLMTFNDAVAWLKSRRAGDQFGYVVTPNVDHLVRLDRARDAFAPLYDAAELRLCDSRVVSGLARLAGITLPVVPGSDLVVALFEAVLSAGDIVTIVGGRGAAVETLRAKFPLLDLRHVDAPLGLRDSSELRGSIVTALASHTARFTLIAVGSPQQEMLASEMLASPGMTGTGLCIGASIDFIVGDQQRAPRVMQRLGVEWAWRLASNPRRLWRRYLVEGPRIFLIFRAWRNGVRGNARRAG